MAEMAPVIGDHQMMGDRECVIRSSTSLAHALPDESDDFFSRDDLTLSLGFASAECRRSRHFGNGNSSNDRVKKRPCALYRRKQATDKRLCKRRSAKLSVFSDFDDAKRNCVYILMRKCVSRSLEIDLVVLQFSEFLTERLILH